MVEIEEIKRVTMELVEGNMPISKALPEPYTNYDEVGNSYIELDKKTSENIGDYEEVTAQEQVLTLEEQEIK